jgi:hypothetical protein
MDGDQDHRHRFAGKAVRAIGTAAGTTLATINDVIDGRATSMTVFRKHTLALARLDELQRCSTAAPLRRCVLRSAGQQADRRRCVMLGLQTPQRAVLQIIDSTKPKGTAADRIERAITELTAQDRPTTTRPPLTHQFR